MGDTSHPGFSTTLEELKMLYGILKSSVNTGTDSEILIPFVAPLQVRSNRPSFGGDSLNLRRSSVSLPVQRWELEVNLMPSNNNADYLVHTAKYDTTLSFEVRMPQVYGLTLTTVAPTIPSIYAAGSSQITLSSSLAAGEFIKFSNHNKVYLVTDGGTNGVNIKIMPPLQKQIGTGDTVIVNVITAKMFYDKDVQQGITFIDGILSDPGSVKLVEDVR